MQHKTLILDNKEDKLWEKKTPISKLRGQLGIVDLVSEKVKS